MKTFNELKEGDYIFHVIKGQNGPCEAYRILDISELYEENVYELTWFGCNDIKCILSIKKDDLEKSEYLYPSQSLSFNENEEVFITEYHIENKGLGKYIHNSDRKEYEVIDDNFKSNTLKYFGGEYLTWQKGLILYKACYDNPEGIWYSRYSEDFYKNFTRIC